MPDFEQIQRDKANDLTDRIMTRIGEMYLKSHVWTPGQFESSFGSSFSTGPRDEIRDVILFWLTEEKEDG